MLFRSCGHDEKMPLQCPSCGNTDLYPTGLGTQRIEETLKEFFPEARILRVDRDSTRTKEALNDLFLKMKHREIDILIGTHGITGKNVKFKNLGLLIIDEEQKFGVTTKEKLREFKANVDTLTLTATPIPRTLQFSLMGARDLSIINTPPPNRQPIETELIPFDPEQLKEIIEFEVYRG